MSDLRERLERHAVPFLACLEGCSRDDAWNTANHWQTFDDDKQRGDKALARHWSQSLDDAASELERLNGEGAGVFLTVNPTDGRGRKKANISAIRGHHADLDSKDATEPFDLARLPLPPTMAVRTPGGWHLYWLALEPMPCDGEVRWKEHEAELKSIQGALASFGADRNACTVERVLRLPGFMHRKAEPRMVVLVTVDGPRYTREQIRAAFPPVMTKPKEQASMTPADAPMAHRPERADVLERAGRYLDTMPEGIQGRNGSGATFNAALKIIDGYDLSEDEALSLMLERYNPRCVPPWTVDELRKKVMDAAPLCQDRGHLLRTGRIKDTGKQRLAPGSPELLSMPPAPGDAPPAGPRGAYGEPVEPEGFELPPLPGEDGRHFVHPTLPLPASWIVGNVGRMLTEDPPPVRWLVFGLVPAGIEGILAARAGAGKSMTALSIAMGLASGLGVLGRAVSQEESRGVIFAGLEDDEAEFHRRVRRGIALLEEDPEWTEAHRENLTQRLVPLFPNRASGASFRLEDQWQTLAEKAAAIPGGCGLIILDTLSRMADGDENSAKDMRPFNEAVSALAQTTGATVLSIHHLGKGNDGNSDKKLWQRLHPEALRGSSAIEGAARFIIQMAALSPSEAQAAGLEADSALRGAYVAFHLSKISSAEKGSTVLLERRQSTEPGAGFLGLHPDSERILAVIQGQAAVMKLTKRDSVLLAIAEAGGLGHLDQKAAAAQIWPDAGNPKGQWDKMMSELRKGGFLRDPSLTDAGWAKVETLGFVPSHRRAVQVPNPARGPETQELPPGRGETEETEGKNTVIPSFPSGTLGQRNGRKESGWCEQLAIPGLPAVAGGVFAVDL